MCESRKKPQEACSKKKRKKHSLDVEERRDGDVSKERGP